MLRREYDPNMQKTTTDLVDVRTGLSDNSSQWESALSDYLHQLAEVQEELLKLLEAKRRLMAAKDLQGMSALQTQEQQVCARLEELQSQRMQMLAAARQQGFAVENLSSLANQLEQGKRSKLHRQMQDLQAHLRLTQHAALTNWVLAQRSLLHVVQMLEILATGGRLVPTYDPERAIPWSGGLVDQQA